MQTFDVAHINEQGQDIIFVLLARKVAQYTPDEKERIRLALTECARSAGLAGTIVLVCNDHNGDCQFWAEQRLRAFLQSITYELIVRNVNKRLRCSF